MHQKFRTAIIRLAAAQIANRVPPDPDAPDHFWDIWIELRLKVLEIQKLVKDDELLCPKFRKVTVRVCAGLMLGQGLPA